MMPEEFSCLMAVYSGDDAEWLREALESLDAQSRPASEVLLIEDGPISEELTQVMEAFAGRLPLRRLRSEVRKGLGASLQRGLQACKYDLVARMDADDVAAPSRFAVQVAELEKEQATSVVGSWARVIDASGVVVGERRYPVDNDDIKRAIWANPLIHSSVVYRRNDILRVGGYDERLPRRQDYDLWFRCASAGLRFHNVPETLIDYRASGKHGRRRIISDALVHVRVGMKGASLLRLRAVERMMIASPLVFALLPGKLGNGLRRLVSRWDPRQRDEARDKCEEC